MLAIVGPHFDPIATPLICLKLVMLTIVKFSIVDRLSTIENISISTFDINIELNSIVSKKVGKNIGTFLTPF